MLLRSSANSSDLSGSYEVAGAEDRPYLTFRYTVVRLWQESLDNLLAAGPAVAPLALLTDEAADEPEPTAETGQGESAPEAAPVSEEPPVLAEVKT